MDKLTPKQAMICAIEEGRRGAGFVSPNPLVGCVIVDKHGRLLAKGFHERLGQNHAEANALKNVADPARLDGAHVYVTLEPCAHEGRTPSCAKTLAKTPIASVTYGVEDPNPLVSGQGAAILKAAGKKVDVFPDLRVELEELAEIFLMNMRHKRPFVAAKMATSLDGKIALSEGTSQWITGEKSREHVQYLRGCYDAVLTGVGTFLRDNPRLNSRDVRFADKRQRVVLLDPNGRSFPYLQNSELFKVRGPEDVILVTGPLGHRPPVGKQVEISVEGGAFNLPDLLSALRAEGLHSLFVEAGPQTIGQFLKGSLVDRLFLFLAPKIIGEGMTWPTGFALNSLDQAFYLENLRSEMKGEDLFLTGRPQTRFAV